MRKSLVLVECLAEVPELAAVADYYPHAFATLLDMTLRSLERQCRDCFGMSPTELLNKMWLIEAKRLLEGKLAKQIFDEAGCQWRPDFSRKFKSVAGVSITQWKKSAAQESTNAVAKLFTLLYVYDGMRVIQERDYANYPTVAYTRGHDLSGTMEGAGGIGGLLGRSHGYSSGSWSTHNSYHADGGGNVTYLVNSSQTLAASYRFDPYGNTISSSGSLAGANVYRFSSKEIHVNSGFYSYGYRFYVPNLQRWANRDPRAEVGFESLRNGRTPWNIPISGSYVFVGNSPIESIDSDGLKKKRLRFYGPYVCLLLKDEKYCPKWKLINHRCTYICVDNAEDPTEIFMEVRPTTFKCSKGIMIWIPYESTE